MNRCRWVGLFSLLGWMLMKVKVLLCFWVVILILMVLL